MMTNKEATQRGLEMLGWKVNYGARTKKYLVFCHAEKPGQFLLGKAGALRFVRPGQPISSSRSMSDTRLHVDLQQLGRRAASA